MPSRQVVQEGNQCVVILIRLRIVVIPALDDDKLLRDGQSIIVVVRSANLRFDRGANNDYPTVISFAMLSTISDG